MVDCIRAAPSLPFRNNVLTHKNNVLSHIAVPPLYHSKGMILVHDILTNGLTLMAVLILRVTLVEFYVSGTSVILSQ